MNKVRVVFFLPKVTKKLGHYDRISTRVFVYNELLGNAFVFKGQVVALMGQFAPASCLGLLWAYAVHSNHVRGFCALLINKSRNERSALILNLIVKKRFRFFGVNSIHAFIHTTR